MSGQLYLRDINNTTYPSTIFGSINYYSTNGYHGGGIYFNWWTVQLQIEVMLLMVLDLLLLVVI